MKIRKQILISALLLGVLIPRLSAEIIGEGTVEHNNPDKIKPIPVSLSGFSGEVDSVLRLDLYVVGFEFVGADQAQFLISGKNNGHVEGRVQDALSKANLLSNAYNGSSPRTEAHALANDIVKAITGKPGIFTGKIAFKIGEYRPSEIAVADFDGHNTVSVTQDGSQVSAPCWIPNSRKLLYCSWLNGVPQIFEHDLTSRARKIFAKYPGANYSPTVSPDGRRVAMVLNKSENPDLYVCDIDGNNLKQLTKTIEAKSSPCWSPNSEQICFVSGSARPALYKINVNGGEAHRISTGGVGSKLTEPDWSPDGKTIVFTSSTGNFSICTVPAEGGEAKVIAGGEDPCWAPNSRTVIFTRREKTKRVLSLLDVPTKHVKDVTQISGSCSQPSWAR